MGELPWPAWEIDRIYISPMIKTVTGIPSRIYGLFSKCFLDENNPTLLLLNIIEISVAFCVTFA